MIIIVFLLWKFFLFYSGSAADSPYNNQNDSTNNHGTNGFLSRSPQTEPVDFSGARPMGFGLIGPTPYSRESTPDSGSASHYIDNFRDPSGNFWIINVTRNISEFFSHSVLLF